MLRCHRIEIQDIHVVPLKKDLSALRLKKKKEEAQGGLRLFLRKNSNKTPSCFHTEKKKRKSPRQSDYTGCHCATKNLWRQAEFNTASRDPGNNAMHCMLAAPPRPSSSTNSSVCSRSKPGDPLPGWDRDRRRAIPPTSGSTLKTKEKKSFRRHPEGMCLWHCLKKTEQNKKTNPCCFSWGYAIDSRHLPSHTHTHTHQTNKCTRPRRQQDGFCA